MAASPILVEAPVTQSAPFGLLSVAYTDERPDDRLALAGVQYEGRGCAPVFVSPADCPPAQRPEDDFYDGREWVLSGDPYVVWADHRCRLVGDTTTGPEERAREALRLREGTAHERQLAAALPLLEARENLTPAGGAVGAVDGLALLESYARAAYGGTPTFHATPQVATVLGAHGALARVSGRLETVLGSYVAAGAGYIDAEGPAPIPAEEGDPLVPIPAGVGESWLYVTGPVGVWRSPVQTYPVDMVQRNEHGALADRAAALTVECIVAAVLVRTGFDQTAAGGA